MVYLFEASWEVCNKVSSVHTALYTKTEHATKTYGDNYFLFGPLLNENPEFKPSDEPWTSVVLAAIEPTGLKCRCGRWNAPGEPKTILIDFQDHYDVNKLLYSYWRDFGVDSYSGKWDYMEPTLFSTACGEAIAAIHQTLVQGGDKAVAHMHEWLMGGGVLHLKKHLPEIAIVFTVHGTTLGRCIAGLGRDVHTQLEHINPIEEAKTYGIPAKHYMESIAAREADYFTTVSDLAAEEATAILGRNPDLIVHSGINTASFPDYSVERGKASEDRTYLLHFARNFLQKDLPEDTRFWATSGYYEFHNEGFDVFLESLARVDSLLAQKPDTSPVVAFFLIPTGHKGVQDGAHRRIHGNQNWDQGVPAGITTHHLPDEQNDPIIRACQRLNLRNASNNKVNIIFSPAFLDGHDGIIDRPYLDILAAMDLGIFPSFYEPWGYSPLESLALAVPTITTDLAGLGGWAKSAGDENGVDIVPRHSQSPEAVVDDLTRLLHQHAVIDENGQQNLRQKSRQLALQADWNNFYEDYITAYENALSKAETRFETPDTSAFKCWLHSDSPHFRSFTAVTNAPQSIAGIYDLAHNLWWSWQPEARELFAEIDKDLWISNKCNPVKLLNSVPNEVMEEKARDADFVKRFNRVYDSFKEYMADDSSVLEENSAIGEKTPVAYFSMEFGLHECLPIYSGGLGVLAGDHLKAASDLNIPLVGLGLFYRNGYFTQRIDGDGNQTEEYPVLDCSMLPVKAVCGENGQEARISVKLPGRVVHARAWEVQVGRIKLYLLDTDVEENEPDDRYLTNQLYGGDRRTRIKQEILAGVGGVRLLRDVLKLSPSAYHMNEGHCAFLTLERIKFFMQHRNLSFQEAREAVKASTVFTTHTPVPAGNETFSIEVLDHYLRDYVCGDIRIAWEQFIELGKEAKHRDEHNFSMTVLALKLSSKANAVAKLHGKVSRNMWQNVWKDITAEEVPIFPITNGIHTQTFLSKGMRQLYNEHLEIEWGKNEDDPDLWKGVYDISDEVLWEAKQKQKEKFIEFIRAKIERDYTRRGENPQLLRDTLAGLRPDILTIGFARRFASYKRANLLLRDFERAKRILTNTDHPLLLIFAGKAHPADGIGKDLIRQIVAASRSDEFKGRLIFLENYDMGIGRLLTRGVDVWLNNPIRPMEASGTSGMKLCPNGGLNFSILDGWWDEAYTPDVGWKISTRAEYRNRDHQDEIDNAAMLDTLEKEILPLYYDRNKAGFSPGWLKLVKNSIATLSPQFSTLRMVKQYLLQSYEPTAERDRLLKENEYQDIKKLTAWKQMISSRFASLQVTKVEVEGIRSDRLIQTGDELTVNVYVYPGKLAASEIQAEFVIGVRKGNDFVDKPQALPFREYQEVDGENVLHYKLKHKVSASGNYMYAVRVVPVHPLLSSPQETGLACWA